QIAERAYAYLTGHFLDPEFGGVVWTVDYKGRILDAKKKAYAQAFALYGFAEFYIATGYEAALDNAFRIYNLIENRCRDQEFGGYFETFERDWSLALDQRLSDVDLDEKKSMNTHLHILEAYATLARASGDEQVRERLAALVNIFLAHIISPQRDYLEMFFDQSWTSKSRRRSFGHDIEASWLLCEAAGVLGDSRLAATVRDAALKIAQSVHDEGLDGDGSLLYEADPGGIIDFNRDWWVQAEAVVGFVNAYQLSGAGHFLKAAMRAWAYIQANVIDKTNGEWFWRVSSDGVPSIENPKLSQWKCPYHNGRMCFEVSRRLSAIKEESLHGPHRV
ncbi:MAG TPA: AGE family epimerase/isomerase, partial [Blastocatellia bacterium]|nr:AGE family epimerase/isomerase [Blastocatellia bacterium]